MFQERFRFGGPIVEVGRRSHHGHSGHALIGRRSGKTHRSSGAESNDPKWGFRHTLSQLFQASHGVFDPPDQAEVTGRGSTAPEAEAKRVPADLGGEAITKFGQVFADLFGHDHPAGKTMQNQDRMGIGASLMWSRKVGVKRPSAGRVHADLFGQRTALTREQAIAAVATFGRSVGGETDERLRLQQFMEHVLILERVHVVQDLGALVPDISEVSEILRPVHRFNLVP